jgi:hypothetical protein
VRASPAAKEAIEDKIFGVSWGRDECAMVGLEDNGPED